MNNQFTHFECRNLELSLGGKKLFSNFNFRFSGPGIVMIEGDNGTGKSTLLKVFAGFISAEKSVVLFSGCPVTEIKVGEFSFFTTTSLGLLNELTGLEHVELISRIMKLDSQFVAQKILEYQEIEIFNEILHKQVCDFSQGMKQVLRLFLHLFFVPKVLFLDEPFLYLSPSVKEFFQIKIEKLSLVSLVFITDQKFLWSPVAKKDIILLGGK